MKYVKNKEIYNELERKLEIENKSKLTLERYTKTIQDMDIYFKERDMYKIKEKEIEEYVYYLHKNTKSPRTYNGKIAAIRYLYKKVLKKEVEDILLLKRIPKKDKIIPSEEEVIMLFENCKDEELRLSMLLSIGSGLRIGEITTLKISEIKSKRYVIEKTGKGGKTREVPIEESVIEELRKYYKDTRERIKGNEYIFSRNNYKGHIENEEIRRKLKRLNKEVGLNGYTIHDLRSVFATLMYMKTKDVVKVQRYLGHDDIRTTMKYINIEKYTNKKEISVIPRLILNRKDGLSHE